MPYGRRLDWPGAMHHVMSRGIDGLGILKDAFLKRRMVELLNRYLPEAEAIVHSWALMNNHFHLLIQTGEVPLSAVMHRLLTAYSVWYNIRSDRTGRVFQGRYRSILVDREDYYFTLIAYINSNPLRAGYVLDSDKLKTYQFCGDACLNGERQRYKWEYDSSISADYTDNYRREMGELKGKVGTEEYPYELGMGNYVLSSAGVMKSSGPAPSENSQTWSSRNFVLGRSSFIREVVSSEFDKRILPIRDRRKQHEMAESALNSVCRIFNVSRSSIAGRSRRKQIVRARTLFIQYLVLCCGFSFSDAARLMHRSRQVVCYLFNKKPEIELFNVLRDNE